MNNKCLRCDREIDSDEKNSGFCKECADKIINESRSKNENQNAGGCIGIAALVILAPLTFVFLSIDSIRGIGVLGLIICLSIIAAIIIAKKQSDVNALEKVRKVFIDRNEQLKDIIQAREEIKIAGKCEAQASEEMSVPLVPQVKDGHSIAYKYDNVKIFIPDDCEISQCTIYDETELVQEPNNQYDSNAVMIVFRGVKVGYLYRGFIQDIVNDFLNKDLPVFSYIHSIGYDSRAAFINLYLYKNKEAGVKTMRFRLTGNKNRDAQESIEYLSENDSVDIEYDHDKEKYRATSGEFIGYLPASANRFAEDGSEFVVDEIEIDDNYKYRVIVSVEK